MADPDLLERYIVKKQHITSVFNLLDSFLVSKKVRHGSRFSSCLIFSGSSPISTSQRFKSSALFLPSVNSHNLSLTQVACRDVTLLSASVVTSHSGVDVFEILLFLYPPCSYVNYSNAALLPALLRNPTE